MGTRKFKIEDPIAMLVVREYVVEITDEDLENADGDIHEAIAEAISNYDGDMNEDNRQVIDNAYDYTWKEITDKEDN